MMLNFMQNMSHPDRVFFNDSVDGIVTNIKLKSMLRD